MEDFTLDQFFSLNDWAYPELFADCTYAWDPIGKLEAYLDSCELGMILSPIPEGVYLLHPELISIGKNTVIEPGAFIKGPCIIGDECEVRHGAYIRGNVITGNQCVIGHASELKNAILLNRVAAGHFNYVGDSLLGNGVNIGAGVKLANLRLDSTGVQIVHNGVKISTGLEKLGAVIGDGAQLGCNVVTNPGTLIGRGAFCHPCLSVSGYVSPRAIVKTTKRVGRDYVDRGSY